MPHPYTRWQDPGDPTGSEECRICGRRPGDPDAPDCRPPASPARGRRRADAPTTTIPLDGTPEQVEAALAALPASGAMRVRILAYVAGRGDRGATDEEIEAALRGKHQSVSACRRGLVLDGLMADGIARRATTSGRAARVRYVTPAGRAELAAALTRHAVS